MYSVFAFDLDLVSRLYDNNLRQQSKIREGISRQRYALNNLCELL